MPGVDQFVMWAVFSDCWNMAFRAVVMSAGVLAVKKKFGDAQPLRLGGIFTMLLLA
jgi:hypothetical protein